MENHQLDNRMEKEWMPLGRLPNWSRKGIAKKSIQNCNRYLEYQERRLKKAYNDGKFEKVVLIWFLLLKNSKSYQIALFNRVKKDWYIAMNQVEARDLLRRVMNKCRRWDWQLMLERFYILKKNGKWRPIGSPTIESRVMSKSLTDLITFLFEDTRGIHQHAYRMNKGVWSCLLEVAAKLKRGNQEVFEFDLKSFFNKVRWHWINMKLATKSEMLADLVYGMLVRIHYTFKELKPEAELKPREQLHKHNGRMWPVIVREGLPQGLSVSPLLATLAIERTNMPTDMVMYADDGLYIGNEFDSVFCEWVDEVANYGVQLEWVKSGFVKDKFNFLGVEISLTEETFKYEGSTISIHDEKLEEWTKKVASFYGKKSEGWTWKIKSNSYLWNIKEEVDWWTTLNVVWRSVWAGESYKGYRFFWNRGIKDVIGSSSKCMEALLSNINQLNLKRVLPLLVPKTRNYKYPFQKKNIYIEQLREEQLISLYSKQAVAGKVEESWEWAQKVNPTLVLGKKIDIKF